MSSVPLLLARGNGKLGEAIFHFDLPAINTCPGRTDLCAGLCYATRGRFNTGPSKRRLRRNLRQSRGTDFGERLTEEIDRRGVIVLRLHVSGDFYSAEYAAAWASVMRARPCVRFYFYTRSWRVPAIVPALEDMAGLANCRAWYSVDQESGRPEVVPPGVRLAYLQTSELVDPEAHLVFRLKRLRKLPLVGLPLVVCPEETPEGHQRGVNCGSCRHCWH